MNTMFFSFLSFLTVSIFVLSFSAEAQNKKRTVIKNGSPTVVVNKSGVYISFERFGRREPLREDENGEGVWLRLHNNMRYSISLCAFGISEKGEQLLMYGKSTQIGVKYDIVPNPISETDNDPQPVVPLGYNTGSTCHLFEVKSGKSIVFSAPTEHLVKGLSIKVPFSYEWEEETINNPTHFVFFNSLNIPKK